MRRRNAGASPMTTGSSTLLLRQVEAQRRTPSAHVPAQWHPGTLRAAAGATARRRCLTRKMRRLEYAYQWKKAVCSIDDDQQTEKSMKEK
jgi:hypothetical protein